MENAPDVYAYNDFRRFLTDWLEWKAANEAGWSKAECSRRLGLPRSRSFLPDVLRGKPISDAFVERFVRVLEFDTEAFSLARESEVRSRGSGAMRTPSGATPKSRLGRMRPADTSPEAWKVQVEILRRKGPLERLLMACRMSDEMHGWERASLQARESALDRGA